MIPNTLVPHVLAMCSSVAAVVTLGMVARKLGGQIGLMLKLLLGGVFLAVFVHAAAELAQATGLLDHGVLMTAMGTLLTLGSLSLCGAAWVGWKALQ